MTSIINKTKIRNTPFYAVIIYLLLGANTSFAGIGFVGTAETSGVDVASLTFAHNVVPSSNTLLVVFTCARTRDNGTVTSLTYNGDALTQVTTHTESAPSISDLYAEIWYRVSPDTGNNNVVVNFSATADSATVNAISALFTGVNQATPQDAAAVNTSGDVITTLNQNITTASGKAFILSNLCSGSLDTAIDHATQTEIANVTADGNDDSAEEVTYEEKLTAGVDNQVFSNITSGSQILQSWAIKLNERILSVH